ncbi:MAG: 4-phosphopantetheinyl transferase family protein [Vicinamibacteria bacterium]|nr:4-phosphopantetheinyl transferase family protein [Vicinamibacteria bacterium]
MKASFHFNSNERGEGQVGSVVMLIVLIALAVVAVNVGPIWWANYQFEDRLTEIAGKFPPNKNGDVSAKEAIFKAVEDSGLRPYLDPETCEVTSQGGLGGLRTVTCTYDREYKIFGSKKKKTFVVTISRPMF